MTDRELNEDWNMAIARLEQLASLVEDVRRYHYRARKHRNFKSTKIYKEMVYNLFFEIRMYIENRDRDWDRYIKEEDGDIKSYEDIKNEFKDLDKDITGVALTEQECLDLIERIENLDNIINRARMSEGLDIPKPKEEDDPWNTAVSQKKS